MIKTRTLDQLMILTMFVGLARFTNSNPPTWAGWAVLSIILGITYLIARGK